MITLPYLRALSENYSEAAIDFVTLAENADVPRALTLFDHVFAIGGGRSPVCTSSPRPRSRPD